MPHFQSTSIFTVCVNDFKSKEKTKLSKTPFILKWHNGKEVVDKN